MTRRLNNDLTPRERQRLADETVAHLARRVTPHEPRTATALMTGSEAATVAEVIDAELDAEDRAARHHDRDAWPKAG